MIPMELIWSVMVLVPATGNEKDPLHPSSPLTRTHTAAASESPSFPQRAHSATPGKKDKSSDANWRENKHSVVWGSFNPVFKQMNFTSTRLEMRTRFLSGTISPSREHMATMCWHWSSNTTLWIPAEVKTEIAFPCPAKYALIHITAGEKNEEKKGTKQQRRTQARENDCESDLRRVSWGVTGWQWGWLPDRGSPTDHRLRWNRSVEMPSASPERHTHKKRNKNSLWC